MRDQHELAQTIVASLKRSGSFDDVQVIGSVATQTFDELSDIDILLFNEQRPPWENVALASDIIADEFGVMLKDWAGSLIPEKYLINHFLPDQPIFWWIDLGCQQNPNFKDITRSDVKEEWNTHIAKLLIMNAKHYIRGDRDRLRVAELYTKVFPSKELPQQLGHAFLEIHRAVDYANIADDVQTKVGDLVDRVGRIETRSG